MKKNNSLTVVFNPRFDKDLKRMKKKGADESKLFEVVKELKNNKILAPKYNDHKLEGKLKDFRECHIEDDWLLIYKKEKTRLILVLARTGSHDELFKKK